ncbi:MAG: hypothetical protein MAG451_00324 [Anaerolineales bacterium]|nr:hypothetical protein [Anaerolineales bacterium]
MRSCSRRILTKVSKIAGLLWLVGILTLGPSPAYGYRGPYNASAPPPLLQDSCPGNTLTNPDFEFGARKTENLGTSLSSSVAHGWFPWFIRGDQRVNREPEFKLEDATRDPLRWRVHNGYFSQKFFTTWATHDAGIYQRVPVRTGSVVNFSIWFQTYTGEADGWDGEKHHSDPDAPGNYRTFIGIDPYGNTPAGVGAPPPDTVIWTEPMMVYDTWTQVNVQAVAQADHVTVYTRGQPEFAVKHNDSFWDTACLVVAGPAIPEGFDAVVDTALLNFRAGPGTEYDVIGTLERGDPLKVGARLSDSSWLQVTDDAETAGWVFTGLVKLGIDLADVPVAQEIPPTPTATPTITPTPSQTPVPTATQTPTDTPLPTDTPELTETAEPATAVVVTVTPEASTKVQTPETESAPDSAPPSQRQPGALNCAPALIGLTLGLLGLVVWPRRRTTNSN